MVENYIYVYFFFELRIYLVNQIERELRVKTYHSPLNTGIRGIAFWMTEFNGMRFLSEQTNKLILFFFSFTSSRVIKEIIVLWHSAPHLTPKSRDIGCWVAEHNSALCLYTRAKKWKHKFKVFYEYYINMYLLQLWAV